jgi:hypothetical protein
LSHGMYDLDLPPSRTARTSPTILLFKAFCTLGHLFLHSSYDFLSVSCVFVDLPF